MDIKSLKPSERTVEILNPGTKQPVGIRVGLLHVDDESLQKLRRKIQDERYRLEAKGKVFKTEMFEENMNELAFGAMTGWEWYNPTGEVGKKGYKADAAYTLNGEAAPAFTKKNVLEIFEVLPWFRRQIAEEIGDDEAFF
jgi:hypothetical protein